MSEYYLVPNKPQDRHVNRLLFLSNDFPEICMIIGCTTAGLKGKKKTEEVIDLLDEEDGDDDDNSSQQMRSSPQPASALRVTHHPLPSNHLNAHMHGQCS